MALRRNPRLRRAIRRIMLPRRTNVPWLAVPRRMRRPSSTVRHRNMVRTVPCRRSRLMAPQPRTILRMVRRTYPRSRNMARTGRLRSSRSGLAILSSEIRMWVEISRTINYSFPTHTTSQCTVSSTGNNHICTDTSTALQYRLSTSRQRPETRGENRQYLPTIKPPQVRQRNTDHISHFSSYRALHFYLNRQLLFLTHTNSHLKKIAHKDDENSQ